MIVLVTGANSGIGLEFVRYTLHRDASTTVLMACRDVEKARDAVVLLKREFGETVDVRVELLDLASLASVRALATRVTSEFRQLDVLVNNAGIMFAPRSTTVDGIDVTFQTNHLGHFLLTLLLLPLLEAAPRARVVNVSSVVHWFGWLSPGDVSLRDVNALIYREQAYCQSKLCNLLFSLALDKRLKQRNSKVLVVNAHPGWSHTNLMTTPRETSHLYNLVFCLGNPVLSQSPERGAIPICYAAFADDVQPNDFYGPSGVLGLGGASATRCSRSSTALDAHAAERLWQISESLAHCRFNELIAQR